MRSLLCFFIVLIQFFGYAQSEIYKVTNLTINNEYPHFGLMRVDSNKIIYTSYLLAKNGKVKRVGGDAVLTIFEGELSDDGQIVNTKPVLIDPEYDISHITSACISPNGHYIYLATNYNRKDRPKGDFKDTNFHIKVGEYKEGVGFTNFKVLPFCKPRYSYAHPALSKDGKELYFIANLRGGKETTKGGSDIFKVAILGDNTYTEPKNLGSKVNSYSREMFPYVSADNTLYFASNRPNGFGGFDIYKSIMSNEGVFEKAVKMPKPINSNKDDFCFILDDNTGYFSSKRTEGKGDDDIYYFTLN